MSTTDADLSVAFHHHQAGRRADAARCYDALLARWPDYADSLHLFGVLHHQSGFHERAAELMPAPSPFGPTRPPFTPIWAKSGAL